MVISYFTHDTRSLMACSMTCYSWYIAAVPHLHHSLTTDTSQFYSGIDEKYVWPMPLQKSYELGLLPLVKRFRVRLENSSSIKFTPERFSGCTMRHFRALTNLQELGIDFLQVPSFMSTIQRCFGHFSPTLRFLALKQPTGSCRQILYFIGLFPNLQDLRIFYPFPKHELESTADATLTPLSVPPPVWTVDTYMFHEEETCKGDDFPFRRTSFPSDGPLQGEVCTAPFRRVHGNPRDVEAVPIRSVR